jgi:hypothetical protein
MLLQKRDALDTLFGVLAVGKMEPPQKGPLHVPTATPDKIIEGISFLPDSPN